MTTPGSIREIAVTAGAPPGDVGSTRIRINRLHTNSAGVPKTPLHSSASASTAVYEIPATPSTNCEKDPTPRLDLGARASGIFELPPTPPPGHVNRSKVREISVASFDIPEAEGEEDGALAVKVEPQGKQLEEKDKKGVPRSKSSESSLMDFSLFLMKNAKTRDEIRARTRDLSHGASSEPEEDIETLLRRWETAQAEEAAALEKKDSSVHVSALPMFPSLLELPLLNFINFEGKINPQVDADAPVSVCAVFDRIKRVQYIGISTDIRDTMRKLIGRRPSLCYYYKLYNYPNVDKPQPQLLKERWIAELGYTPQGNLDPAQKRQWEQAVDAGPFATKSAALSAAIQKAKQLVQVMVERGLKEEMVYDPALMEFGRCDILQATTPAQGTKCKQTTIKTPFGTSIEYFISYNSKSETSSGWKYDISLSKDNQETRHLVTYDRSGPDHLTEDEFLELALGFLLHKGIPRDRVSRAGFTMAKFYLSEVAKRFQDFKAWFDKTTRQHQQRQIQAQRT